MHVNYVGFEIQVKCNTKRLFILFKKFVDDKFGKSAFVFFKRLPKWVSIPRLFYYCKIAKVSFAIQSIEGDTHSARNMLDCQKRPLFLHEHNLQFIANLM